MFCVWPVDHFSLTPSSLVLTRNQLWHISWSTLFCDPKISLTHALMNHLQPVAARHMCFVYRSVEQKKFVELKLLTMFLAVWATLTTEGVKSAEVGLHTVFLNKVISYLKLYNKSTFPGDFTCGLVCGLVDNGHQMPMWREQGKGLNCLPVILPRVMHISTEILR
jgi:hypothetical protein